MASADTTQTPGNGQTIEQQISELRDSLSSLTVDTMGDNELVALRDAIKSLEDDIEEVRKEAVDSELKDRIPVGGSLLGLSHIGSHNKFLKEDDGTVVMRAVSKGIDYNDFVKVNASQLAKEYPDLAEIGEAEYSYLR
jgi:hypothetical protein